MTDTTVVRVPKWQLKLWVACADEARTAAGTECASVTEGMLEALLVHLRYALMVAEADDAADDKWERERQPDRRTCTRTFGAGCICAACVWEEDFRESHAPGAAERVRSNWSVEHLREPS